MTTQEPDSASRSAAASATAAPMLSTERAGQANAPEGGARAHTLVIYVHERPGAIDRVVGLLRRRRARMQTLSIGRSEQPDVARITVVIDDSEVAVEQLVEQFRKVVDVHNLINVSSEQMVTRELALIKVNSGGHHNEELIELGHHFGAHVVDMTAETVTLEVTGSAEKVEKLIDGLQQFGIREIARTGSVAMIRGVEQ